MDHRGKISDKGGLTMINDISLGTVIIVLIAAFILVNILAAEMQINYCDSIIKGSKNDK